MLTEEAFIRELTASQDRIFAFIMTLLPDRDLARDVLQETHIQMWRKRDQFVEGTHFVAWACQIARYKVCEHRRTMAKEKLLFDEYLVGQLATDAGRHAEQSAEQTRILEACMGKLSDRQRTLLGERYALGRSLKEIAQRLGRSAGALAVTFFRIRQALASCVERKLAEGTRE
jgi:RNA polymerase sigma-70 factor (ECF subfamily)